VPGLAPSALISDAEWAKIVDAAKKEGKVTCYCWTWKFDYRSRWAEDEFKKATGITFENLVIAGTPAVERIKTEARAGKYVADIFSSILMYHTPAVWEGTGLLKNIDNLPNLKDAKDPDKYFYSPIRFPYTIEWPIEWRTAGGANFMYSSKIVPEDRVPKKWQDLLDPWWKGKLCAANPTAQAGLTFSAWAHFRELGYPDWWPEFYYNLYLKQNEWVKYYIDGQPDPLNTGDCGMNSSAEWGTSAAHLKSRYVIDKAPWLRIGTFDPPHPTKTSSGYSVSVPAKSPHPNAALVFANWLFSQETMLSYSKLGLETVGRRDIPNFIEKEYYPAKAQTKFWAMDAEWVGFEQYSYASKGVFKLIFEGMPKETWLKWMKDGSTTYWGKYPPPPGTFFSLD